VYYVLLDKRKLSSLAGNSFLLEEKLNSPPLVNLARRKRARCEVCCKVIREDEHGNVEGLCKSCGDRFVQFLERLG
jgi:hypothetical protein